MNYQIAKRAAIAGIVVLALAMIPNWEHRITRLQKLQVLGRNMTKVTDTTAAPELIGIADNPALTAKSALAYDFRSGSILFTHNFDERLPVASLTKLVTAIVVYDAQVWNEEVEVQPEDIRVVGANTGLAVGEKIKASELVKAMLIASHNDSTLALARHTGGSVEDFVRRMNNEAYRLGMLNTNFTNPIGFDSRDHYSSAQDLVLALREFLGNPELAEIVKTKETTVSSSDGTISHKLRTTNKLLLEDETVMGVKTGYTAEAKGNLVIRSVKDRADVVTIVLGSDDREGDTRKIVDWIYTVYRW